MILTNSGVLCPWDDEEKKKAWASCSEVVPRERNGAKDIKKPRVRTIEAVLEDKGRRTIRRGADLFPS